MVMVDQCWHSKFCQEALPTCPLDFPVSGLSTGPPDLTGFGLSTGLPDFTGFQSTTSEYGGNSIAPQQLFPVCTMRLKLGIFKMLLNKNREIKTYRQPLK